MARQVGVALGRLARELEELDLPPEYRRALQADHPVEIGRRLMATSDWLQTLTEEQRQDVAVRLAELREERGQSPDRPEQQPAE